MERIEDIHRDAVAEVRKLIAMLTLEVESAEDDAQQDGACTYHLGRILLVHSDLVDIIARLGHEEHSDVIARMAADNA